MRVRGPAIAAVALLGAALGAANAVLVYQNARIRALNAANLAGEHVNVGQILPPFIGTGHAGQALTVSYGAPGDTVILIFEPLCAACLLNATAWKTLVTDLHQRGVPTIAAALGADDLAWDRLVASLARVGLQGVTIVLRPTGNSVFWYHLRLTPQTILLGNGGQVRGVWTGVLAQRDLRAILSAAEQGMPHPSPSAAAQPARRDRF